jgi:hypothetical protein
MDAVPLASANDGAFSGTHYRAADGLLCDRKRLRSFWKDTFQRITLNQAAIFLSKVLRLIIGQVGF